MLVIVWSQVQKICDLKRSRLAGSWNCWRIFLLEKSLLWGRDTWVYWKTYSNTIFLISFCKSKDKSICRQSRDFNSPWFLPNFVDSTLFYWIASIAAAWSWTLLIVGSLIDLETFLVVTSAPVECLRGKFPSLQMPFVAPPSSFGASSPKTQDSSNIGFYLSDRA